MVIQRVQSLAERAAPASPSPSSSPVASSVAWFALKTRSRHERSVARELQARGVHCFLPLARSRRRWSDRVQTVEVPLFSTYAFVRIDLADRLSVLRVRGAVCLLGAPGRGPLPVPDTEIEPLLALAMEGVLLEPHPYVERGRRVRVRSGPFAGLEGVVVRRRGSTRLVLRVRLLQQAGSLEVDLADVDPV